MCLSDPYQLMLQLRQYDEALLGDVTKAYYSILVGVVEMHL